MMFCTYKQEVNQLQNITEENYDNYISTQR